MGKTMMEGAAKSSFQRFTLIVKHVTGEELQLSVRPQDTVIDIKLMVQATAGIDPTLQRCPLVLL